MRKCSSSNSRSVPADELVSQQSKTLVAHVQGRALSKNVCLQLSTACQHVAELRATVPTQLAQRLTEHLQQCRPTPGIPASPQQDAQPAAGHSEGQHAADLAVSQRSAGDQANAVGMTPLSPAPADLQSMYAAAVQRMPALR